jgi:non-ribosomal peptide synthetase component F
MDIWWPLSMGCSIVIPAAGQLQDADAMRALIHQHSVGFLMIVPNHLQASASLSRPSQPDSDKHLQGMVLACSALLHGMVLVI